ncbi:hypothetical protein Tco_1524703 [Tanacetum coccineum]
MFGATEGMFLGHAISQDEIQACSKKAQAVINMAFPRTLIEVQSLNGKLASLNRFLSKAAKKSLSFFKTLKHCIKKSDFVWTKEAEKALKEMKKQMAELPTLTAPIVGETLIMYVSASEEAALQSPEINYTPMEKLVLALILSKTKNSGRLAKWVVELGEHAITYRPRTSIKGQVLADFLAELPVEGKSQNEETVTRNQETKEIWRLFTDSSSKEG